MHVEDLKELRDDVYRRPLLTAIERIGLEPGWKVADVGAGNGDVSVALARVVGPTGRVYSIDVDPKRRNEVAEAASAFSQVVAITQAVEELSLPESVDLAFCRFLLLGVVDPRLAIEKMTRAVRPGGWIVIQEPVTTAGRVGHSPLMADTTLILHPDVGMDVPSMLATTGLREIDSWAEAPMGTQGSDAALYLETMTGIEPGTDTVMLPPLVTSVARKLSSPPQP